MIRCGGVMWWGGRVVVGSPCRTTHPLPAIHHSPTAHHPSPTAVRPPPTKRSPFNPFNTFNSFNSCDPYTHQSPLTYNRHPSSTVYKYRPETCCIVGNYYSLKAQHAKAVLYFQRALKVKLSHHLTRPPTTPLPCPPLPHLTAPSPHNPTIPPP